MSANVIVGLNTTNNSIFQLSTVNFKPFPVKLIGEDTILFVTPNGIEAKTEVNKFSLTPEGTEKECYFIIPFTLPATFHIHKLYITGRFLGKLEITLTSNSSKSITYILTPRLLTFRPCKSTLVIAKENGIASQWEIKVKSLDGNYFELNSIELDAMVVGSFLET